MELLLRLDDTIVAPATSLDSQHALIIIRLSGSKALEIGLKLSKKKRFIPRKMTLSHFYLQSDGHQSIDQGLVVFFEAPKSSTGENVVEFHIHGNPVIAHKIIAETQLLGAKIAMPGEFLYRAFWNKKYSLNQIESLAQLIESKHETALKQATQVLADKSGSLIEAQIHRLGQFRAQLESLIDFSDQEDVQNRALEMCGAELAAWIDHGRKIVEQLESTKKLARGFTVALVGKPNAGKSSLLNRLAQEDLAIVDSKAGTTRDLVQHQMTIKGLFLTFFDTAGLRNTDCSIEQKGIEKTKNLLKKADIIVYLADDSEQLVLDPILQEAPSSAIRYLLLNKTDLSGRCSGPLPRQEPFDAVFALSLKNEDDIQPWLDDLYQRAVPQQNEEHGFLLCSRHQDVLQETLAFAQSAKRSLADVEIAAEYLRLAQERLNTLHAPTTHEDILSKIFSQFCIGK